MVKKSTNNSSPRQQVFMDWALDILIYSTILNIFVEHSSAITIDSYTISLFTAVVLKALLNIIIRFEHRVNEWFLNRQTKVSKIIGTVVGLAILFFSKFLILEVINFIFGEHVTIKGFVPLAAMIITMIVTRKVIEKIYNSLA